MCILLVEDEWLTLLAAAMSLEAAGFDVLTAGHGRQAMDHVDENPGYFTCLITDFHMPGGLTGAHVVEHMRPHYPAIPMIITSALTQPVTEGWRLQHGVDLLSKPYEMLELVVLVGRLLER